MLLLLLVACGGAPSAPTPPAAATAPRVLSPLAVLDTYDFAHNGHDVDAALALFADDAVVIIRSGTFSGKTQIRAWLEREAELNSRAEVKGQRAVQGDTVTWRSRITRDDFKKLGIEFAEADDQAIVQDGKIKSFQSTLTPETLAKLEQAQGTQPTAPSISAARVITGTGATPADLEPTVDAYKQELGGADNGGEPGSKGSGFRTIVWDGVPDELAAPNDYPADFFNAATAPRARGALLKTPGSSLQISADSDNPTNTPRVSATSIPPTRTSSRPLAANASFRRWRATSLTLNFSCRGRISPPSCAGTARCTRMWTPNTLRSNTLTRKAIRWACTEIR